MKLVDGTVTYYESATRRLSRESLENSDLPLREIVQLVCEWVGFLSVPKYLLMDNYF